MSFHISLVTPVLFSLVHFGSLYWLSDLLTSSIPHIVDVVDALYLPLLPTYHNSTARNSEKGDPGGKAVTLSLLTRLTTTASSKALREV